MPQTKDKFKTVMDRPIRKDRPGSVTVIRKDSKYAKDFTKMHDDVMDIYKKNPLKRLKAEFPATANRIDRNAADEIAADRTVGKIKYNAQVTPGKWTTKNN